MQWIIHVGFWTSFCKREKFQLSKELTTTFDLTQNKNVPRFWKGKGVFLLKNFYSNSITKKKDITTVPTTTTGLLALYISESQTISHCLVAPEILSNTWASSWTLTLKGNLNVNFARHDCELLLWSPWKTAVTSFQKHVHFLNNRIY